MIRATLGLVTLTTLLIGLERMLLPSGPLPLGTFALGGVLGCVGIVVVAKLIGKLWLQRPETWDA